MQNKVAPRPHSRISPSMMGRVEECTASYFLAPEVKKRDSNAYAAFGSACHDLAEQMLQDEFLLPYDFLGREWHADGFSGIVDQDMMDAFMPYVDYCQQLQQESDLHGIESRFQLPVHLTEGLSEIFGLVDFFVLKTLPDRDCLIEIVDLKTGRMPVLPDALQTAVYGIMALYAHESHLEGVGDDDIVLKTTIVQPAADEVVSSKLWTLGETQGIVNRVRKLLDRIRRSDFNYSMGDHCRYCPVLGSCPQVRAMAIDPAMAMALPTPDMLARGDITPEVLDDMLAKLTLMKKFEKSIVDLADAYLRAGGTLVNAKLARKRTIRKWKDGKNPVPILEKHGVHPYTKKLISPTQAEKALPKAAYDRLIAPMVEKPVGDLTVAIGEDKRAAVSIADSLKRAAENAQAQALVRHAEESAKSEEEKSA